MEEIERLRKENARLQQAAVDLEKELEGLKWMNKQLENELRRNRNQLQEFHTNNHRLSRIVKAVHCTLLAYPGRLGDPMKLWSDIHAVIEPEIRRDNDHESN